MSELDSIFEFMDLSDHDKVLCTAHMLTKDALYWWKIIKQTLDAQPLTWVQFRELFNEKFYSDAVRNNMIKGFYNLNQGRPSVLEYVCQFERLSRFAPDMMASDKCHKYKFTQGLKPIVAMYVDTRREAPSTYQEVVQRAIEWNHGM